MGGQRKKASDQTGTPRQWVSRAGWRPGLAAPLVTNGELTDHVVRAGQAYAARRRRIIVSRFEYYQLLSVFCQNAERLAARDGGLGEALGQLRETLRENAPEQAVKQAVALAGRVNSLHSGLRQAGRDAGVDAAESVRIVNMHLDTVAAWNRAVSAHRKAGDSPGTALADRLPALDTALDELFRHIDIDYEEKKSGSLIVSMHGANLVYFDRRAEYAPAHASLAPLSGMLAAHIEARDKMFAECSEVLAAWASAFSAIFNRTYRAGSRATDNALFSVDVPFRLAFDPVLVENPSAFDAEAGIRALSEAEEKTAGQTLERFLSDIRAKNAAARDKASQLLACVVWQNKCIADGPGETEMRDLVNCQRTFLAAYGRSGPVERLYQTLVNGGT